VSAARIVVVEDESIIRMDIVEMVTGLGYEVVGEAADGRRGLELIATLHPDLVLLDVAMSGMDGLAAVEAIDPIDGPAVVMVTAFAQDDIVARAVAAGAMGYVVKPFTATELAPVLSVALARHAELHGARHRAQQASDRLAARVVIERAKGHLQRVHGISETEAFGLIRRQAMDARTSMEAVAAQVLAAVDM
jgi:two-component system, response regulator PdtaR